MKKWLQRIGVGALAILIVGIVVGTSYEFISRAQARKQFPAPGRLVDIGGGRHVQLDCRGSGTPVVVFENGLDSLGSLSWAAVHDAIAQTTRACAYSRAGMMWSDPSDRPFSSANVAEDLHNVLNAAGEQAPFVLVAHSLGGPYALVYTHRYGEQVAGLVFVDTSHPDQLARMRAAVGKDLPQPELLATIAARLAWTGVVRAVVAANPPAPPTAPSAIQAPSAAWMPGSLRAVTDEMHGVNATFAAAAGARALGNRPLIALTHSTPPSPEMLRAMEITAPQGNRLEATWRELQREEASWSTRGSNAIVPNASHYIQFDQPQAVIAAVREVVEQVRDQVPQANSK